MKEGVGVDRILKLVKTMSVLHSYNYSCIFYRVRNNDLFYSISLMSLVENVGIIYLRLLSEVSYYKTNLLFIRDFITHSAVFFHCINIIYKISLKDNLIMKIFRVFAVKNFKLICIFKHMWRLSYELILERRDNIFKNFIWHYCEPKESSLYKERSGAIILVEFNSEINLLFDFITKIKLNLKFKKGFEILKITKEFNYETPEEFIRDFDQEELLKFYTEEYENNFLTAGQVCYKDSDYFLNSLSMEYSVAIEFLHDIKIGDLFFIKNENIRRYFFNMWVIAYSKDIFNYFNDTSTTQQSSENVDVQPKKKQRFESELLSSGNFNSNCEQFKDVNSSVTASGFIENNFSSVEDSGIRAGWTLYDQEFVNFLFNNF